MKSHVLVYLVPLICQTVDGGDGSTLKRLSNQEFIRNWAGNVYRKLTQSSYEGFRLRLFQKTSCLITEDGSEDNKVNPEGFPN